MKAILRKNLSTFLTIFMLLVVRSSMADHYLVPTGSMEPTILPGDHILVNKMAYDIKFPFTDLSLKQTAQPQRGDIVVFKYPVDPSITFVKRLIGLPGDHVHVTDGVIEVNSQRLDISEEVESQENRVEYREHLGTETYTVQRLPDHLRPSSQDFFVPQGYYFFMGDNRDNSSDSREWGFVPHEYIKGKALKIVRLPWSKSANRN